MRIDPINSVNFKKHHPLFPLVYSKLLAVQVNLPGCYFSAKQVIEVLEHFPSADYMRVQAFISLFGRITDIENLYIILDVMMKLDEKLEVYHRLGILNVVDPIKIEREYRLDLRRWDHREFAKLLVKLAAIEPGDNWKDVSYRWAKYDSPVPGWLLPMSWTLPDKKDNDGEIVDGPRTHGWLFVTYVSDELGCIPSFGARVNTLII